MTTQAATRDDVDEQAHAPTTRILVVDDEAMIRRALERVLRAKGHEVALAEDGARARELLAAGHFDLVLSDINMPHLDGLGVLKLVRERDPDLPVILFTAEPSADTAIGALQLRATAYLRKPVEPAVVQDAVEEALTLHRLAMARRQAHEIVVKQRGTEAAQPDLNARFDNALAELFMVYQPIVSWKERSVFGYEALVRTREESIPHPGALFEAAENLDRLHELGAAIRRLCTKPLPQLDPRASLFVNLHSADLLDDDLFDATTPLAEVATRVVLEITERAHLGGVRDADERIGRLRQMGFRIAIDDIGAGYSGLNSFAMLKPDLVKLDMALVRGIDRDPLRQRVARMLVKLCSDLGITVVGEGVETTEERDTLIELGCTLLQGYLLAKPAAPFIEPQY